jgi:hypothetical protein
VFSIVYSSGISSWLLFYAHLISHSTAIICQCLRVQDNGAISTVIVNKFPLPIQDIKSKAELDFSSKELKVEDVIIIAALIPSNVSHKPYIALLSLISLSVTREA